MKYEESIANINENGKQSVVLELDDKWIPFLNALSQCDVDNVVMDVLAILAGVCCEGDYVVTTDEDTEHDLDALMHIIEEHDIEPLTREQVTKILQHFKLLLRKRYVTWG